MTSLRRQLIDTKFPSADGLCNKGDIGDAGGEQAYRVERPGKAFHADGREHAE